MKIYQLIRKNYKILIRSKSSALIVLLGPLILMFLVSMAFNSSSLFDIRVGTYSESYSDLSESLILQMQDDQFSVKKIDTQESCIRGVEAGNFHMCAVFPKDFSIKSSESITFYVDKSRLNLVYIIMNSISSKVSVKSSELSTALTTTLINSLNDANTKIEGKKETITSVSGSLNELSNKAGSLSSNLEGLDLNAVSVNISQIETEIGELQNATGISNSELSDLNDLIDSAKSSFSTLNSRLTAVTSIRDSSVSELNNIKTSLDEKQSEVSDIKSTLESISSNINAIEIKDVEKIVTPVGTEIKSISPETTHIGYTFPTLIILVLMFSGILLASTNIVDEKSSKAYFRNFITPTNDTLLLIGQYLFFMIVLFLQIIIIFLVMGYVTKPQFTTTMIGNISLILILVSSTFALLGMFLGYLFKTEETANLASISIAVILLFFSNTILPIETLPKAIRGIAQFNPFVLGETALRKTLLFKESLANNSTTIYILIAYVVIFAALTYLTMQLTKRRVA